MNSFFSNRSQRLFSDDLQQRRKRTIANVIDENTEPNTDGVAEPVGSTSEEGSEKNLSEGKLLPNEEKQNKKNDTNNKMSEIG